VRFRFSVLLFAAAFAISAEAQTPKLQLGGYEQSLRMMEQGECSKAQDRLLPNGRAQAGDEVIMSDLGDCYLRAAKKITDPEAAQRSREIGAGWILAAANAGVRGAQEVAVRLYLDGQVFFVDPYEAAKWYGLWVANHTQMHYGQVEFDAELLKQINGFGQDILLEAHDRAAKWRPTSLPTSKTAL
jgi:hypothetical protein